MPGARSNYGQLTKTQCDLIRMALEGSAFVADRSMNPQMGVTSSVDGDVLTLYPDTTAA